MMQRFVSAFAFLMLVVLVGWMGYCLAYLWSGSMLLLTR